jgi:hypothetical protein
MSPRAHIERIASRKITGFLGTIDEAGDYYDPVHKQNQSLSQHIIADYHGRFLIELIQNAHDAHDRERLNGEISMLLASDEGDSGTLYVANRGQPFEPKNVDALCEMGLSSKPPGEAVGNKGLGFRSVRHVTDAPQVFSRLTEAAGDAFDGYCFTFARGAELDPLLPDATRRAMARADLPAFYIPRWIEDVPAAVAAFAVRGFSTVIRLPLRNAAALAVVRTEMVGLANADAPMLLFLRRICRLESRIEGERLAEHRLCREFGRAETTLGDGAGPMLVDLGENGQFWVARAQIVETEMQAAVTEGLESGALPQSWLGWKGAGEVALAVPVGEDRAGFNPRLYTFLPMGRGATSPFQGHLHGSFFPSSSRVSLDPGVRVNALVLEHGIRLASATAQWLAKHNSTDKDASVPAVTAARAAVDLLIWKTPASLLERDTETEAPGGGDKGTIDLGKVMAVEIARRWSVAALADAGFVPCLSDWTADPLARPTFGPVAWCSPAKARRPVTDGKTFSLEVLARHGSAAGVAPIWAALSQDRTNRLAEFLRQHAGARFADRMTTVERAQIVEALAKSMAKAKRVDVSRWTAFYRDLSEFMGADTASLAGREILICQDGSLRAARSRTQAEPAIGEGLRRRRRRADRETSVFVPPRRGEAEEGIGEDFYPPAPVREFFAFLHDELPWYGDLATARQFLEKDLAVAFESEALLTRISQIVEQDGTKKVMVAGLRWAFAIWRRSVAVKRPVALGPNYRLFVPTMGGEFIRAADAVFSSAWPDRTLGHHLQQFLELAPVGSGDIEDVRGRRIAPPSNAVFGTRHTEAWTTFLSGLGVQLGLEPKSKETTEYTQAWRVSNFDFLKDLALPDAFGPLLKADMESRPGFGTDLPTSTDYDVGALWWLPGQAEIDSFSDDALDAYARLIVEWIGRAEHKHLWTVVKHRHNYVSDRREWPTPLGAFLRSAAWVPCEEPGGDDLRRRRYTGREVWLSMGADRYPPFLRRPSFRFMRSLDRASDSAMQNLRRYAEIRSFNASDSLMAQVGFLAKQFADGCVRRFYERELVNIYNRCWTRLADQHAEAAVSPSAAPLQLLVRRQGQLGLAKARGPGAETIYVRDNADVIAANLVEVIGDPLLDIRSNEPARLGELLQKLYGKQVRRTSALAYDIHVDGTSLDGLPVGPGLVDECPWLRPMLAASLEALDSVDLNRLPADRSGILQVLDRIELQIKPAVTFTLDGTDVTPPTTRAAYHFQREGGSPLVIIVGDGALTWTLVEAALPAIGEAIQHSAVVPHMKLLTRQLAHEDVPVGDRSVDQEDLMRLCRALELGDQAIEAARDSLGERIDRQLPWFRAIVFHLGGDAALDRWLQAELAASEDRSALVDLLRACLPAGGATADDVVQAAKNSFSTGELRERLGLEFAGFNASLVATGGRPDIDPEGQQAQLDHYVEDNRMSIIDALRNMVAPTVLGFKADGRYKTAREGLAGLKPDLDWLQRFERIPEAALTALVADWLAAAGAPAMGENPQGLAELTAVRTSNAASLKAVARSAQPLVRAWGIQNAASVHDVWRDLSQAEMELRRRLDEAGAFDCRSWSEDEFLIWFARLGLWPAEMARTLDRTELGVAETEIEAEAQKERAERERRAREARSVRLNGELRDPLAVDWLKLSLEVSEGLSKRVLSRPIGTFAELAPAEVARRRTRTPGAPGGGGPYSGIPQEKKDMIGRLGELSVYHWLKSRQPGQDIDLGWVSGNAGPFVGRDGNDSLGYDFRIKFNKQTWYIEVKASTEDPCQFEMGETEVRFARDVARSRKPERYVIAYVANVGQTGQTTIDILPNPLSPEGDSALSIAGDSIRYTFTRRR